MGNKRSKPRMIGLVIGILAGVAVGFAQRQWLIQNLNGEFEVVLNTLTLIICAAGGYFFGRMLDKRKTIQKV